MRVSKDNRFDPFGVGVPDRLVSIGGIQRLLSDWVDEFNTIRRSFNGPTFVPYGVDEITRDDLATEFAFGAYSGWGGTGSVTL